jgi:hypothetical protein
MKGTFFARAIASQSGLKESKEKHTPMFFVLFEITQGENKGQTVRWEGWLTEGAQARTIESLIYCGLESDDLASPVGIDKNEVPIVVDEETYMAPVMEKGQPVFDESGKPKTVQRFSSRVQWVNNPARGASVHESMDTAAAAVFAERMKGNIAATRAAMKRPTSKVAAAAESFDFGANTDPNDPNSAETQSANPRVGY